MESSYMQSKRKLRFYRFISAMLLLMVIILTVPYVMGKDAPPKVVFKDHACVQGHWSLNPKETQVFCGQEVLP